MSKKKSSFDDPLNGASFEDIKKLLFAHARRGVTTTEYPYVDGHATLQIDDVEPKAYHLYISLIDSPVKIPCGCRQSMNSTLAIPFPLTVERETVLLRMLVGCMAMPISSPVPSVERAIDAQQYQSVKYVLKMRDLCNF